jgi:hypothetical protein
MGRIAAFIVMLWAGSAGAQVASLFQQAALAGGGGATGARDSQPSLFNGRTPGSLFAPLPRAALPERQGLFQPGRVDRLLALVARAEAGRAGYDAVQAGARIKPPMPPTEMTLRAIYEWIAATPGQPHAIGRYQFIPATLRRVAKKRRFGPDTRFTRGVQDALAVVLLEEAGLTRFKAGTLDRRPFMRNLARIWAGLPLPSGKSYYHGHAGNKATMSWAHFESEMRRIWPDAG